MNIPTTQYEDLLNEFSSETSFEKQKKKSASGNKRFQKKRSGPKQFNGIHRRRRKQIKW